MKNYFRVCTYEYGNAGDFALNYIQELAFETVAGEKINWLRKNPRNLFDEKAAKNSSSNDAIIVGGGGLLYKKDEKTWQWNVTEKGLEAINIPLYLFAVGYNKFRFDEDYGEDFRRDMNLLAEKSTYLGLRNQGSIRKMEGYLSTSNFEKVRFQPCTTTIINKLIDLNDCPKEDVIAINMSFDKNDKRYSCDAVFQRTVQGIANWAKIITKDGIKLQVYSHMNGDELIFDFLQKNGIDCELVDMNPQNGTLFTNFFRAIFKAIDGFGIKRTCTNDSIWLQNSDS